MVYKIYIEDKNHSINDFLKELEKSGIIKLQVSLKGADICIFTEFNENHYFYCVDYEIKILFLEKAAKSYFTNSQFIKATEKDFYNITTCNSKNDRYEGIDIKTNVPQYFFKENQSIPMIYGLSIHHTEFENKEILKSPKRPFLYRTSFNFYVFLANIKNARSLLNLINKIYNYEKENDNE